MTASTTTLNAGSGGDKVLHDTLTTVDGAAAPSGAVAQVLKLAYGPQSTATLVDVGTGLPVQGTFWQATQPVSFTWAGLTDAQLRASAVPISAAALPLPAGAATSAAQTTGNASLSSIDGKLPALSSGAVPVTGPLTDAQLRASSVPTSEVTTATHFQPGFDLAAGAGQGGPLRTDPDGNLVARAQVLTDELGYRANFANSSLAVSIGTATFTNGSATVTGTGFIAADLRTGDYVKLNADAESAWAQVGELVSDSALTLLSAYTGTGGTGASSRAIVKPVTGAGGTIAVASGVCTIQSGTAIGSISEIERDVDWLPVVKGSGVAISQRIANHSTCIGYYDESAPTAPKWFAWFLADGTTNTTIKCQSGRNPTGAPSVAETEETVVTLPNGATTATSRRYRVEVLGDRVVFIIDGITVATHFRSMPGPGDLLTSTVRSVNGASAPATSTTITIDFDMVKNHNKLEVGLLSDVENIAASQPPAQMFAYNQAGVITINTVLLAIDCSQLRHLSVHCTAMGTTGVVTPEWSNDAATWVTATMLSEAGATNTTFNAAVLRTTNVRARYFRLRLSTATTAGTTAITVAGFQQDLTAAVTTQPVSGTVTANIGTGSLAAGTNAVGDVGVQYRANATGAASIANVLSPATPAVQSVKASAGRLLSLVLTNTNAAARYLKVWNTASGSVTLGTTAALFELGIPPGQTVTYGVDGGMGFATAITIAVTGGQGLTNNAAITLGDVTGFIAFA